MFEPQLNGCGLSLIMYIDNLTPHLDHKKQIQLAKYLKRELLTDLFGVTR